MGKLAILESQIFELASKIGMTPSELESLRNNLSQVPYYFNFFF